MRTYFIDANVIMAILISGKSFYKKMVSDYTFIISDFAFEEIEKYKELIIAKTKLDQNSFDEFSFFIFSKIYFLPNFMLKARSVVAATELLQDIDIKDVNYLSLAIQFDYLLLTRDKS